MNRDFFQEHQGEVTLVCTQKTGETEPESEAECHHFKRTCHPSFPDHSAILCKNHFFLSEINVFPQKLSVFITTNNNKAVTRSQSLPSSIARWFYHFHGIFFHVARKYPPWWLVSNKVTWTPVQKTGSSCSSANTSAIEGHPGLGAIQLEISSTLQGCSSPSMVQLKKATC